MFGHDTFATTPFSTSTVTEEVNEPVFDKQWNKQCVNTNTWEAQRVFTSQKRNKCNGT